MVFGVKPASTPELRRKHNLIGSGHIALLFVASLARSVPSHLFWYGVGLWAIMHISLRIYAYVLVRQDRKNCESSTQADFVQENLKGRPN